MLVFCGEVQSRPTPNLEKMTKPDVAILADAGTTDATQSPDPLDASTLDGRADAVCKGCKFGPPVNVGVAAELKEASGLAASRTHAGVLYAHNDSGDTARIFMLGLDGAFINKVTVNNAQAVDWEDIAVGPCPSGSCVFIGDIGDNMKDRSEIKIYRFAEPGLKQKSVQADEFVVRYPDEPHNAETLMVDGEGALYIMTKEMFGAVKLFALGVPPKAPATLKATAVGSFTPPGIDLVTAGDFYPGPCPKMVIRSYGGVFLFQGDAGEGPQALLKRGFVQLAAPGEQQGEAITFSSDGKSMFTVSEGENQPLHRFSCE
jgi:hypothetical protein